MKQHRYKSNLLAEMEARKPKPILPFLFPPFLTGSHRYGMPNFDSDIDLVVMMTQEECDRLIAAAGGQKHHDYQRDPLEAENRVVFRFGELNLIVCLQPSAYFAFKSATECAVKMEESRGYPLSKSEAADLFANIRQEHGIE